MIGGSLFCQNNSIQFISSFGKAKLSKDSFYSFNQNDSIQITALKFYVSNIELLNKTKTVWKDSIQYHLMDAFDEKSLQVRLPSNISFTKLKFNLGIDSATNVSGAMGGDLDPTKGMYWTWQSGYINLKLEGTSTICKTRHNEFQFHLGGYQTPYNNLQTVFIEGISLPVIEVNLDIKKLISQINIAGQHHIMSPGQEANDFSEKIINSLSIKK